MVRIAAACVLVLLSLPAFGAIDDDLREAQQLAWEKRFPEAEARYRAILASHPASRAAALGLGQVLLWEQRYRDAAAVYRRILGDIDARKGLATAEYWSGDFRGAQRDFAAVLRARPNDAEARKALNDIAAASAPAVATDDVATSDDQPMRRTRLDASYTFFTDPLTKWTVSAGTYFLSARKLESLRHVSHVSPTWRKLSSLRTPDEHKTAPFASITGSTSLPAWRLRPSATLRLLRFPDGKSGVLGGVSLTRDRLTFTIDKHELLYTASSLASHPSETEATLGWSRSTDASSSAAAIHATRYFDRNRGRAADAYHLLRLTRWLSLGAAAAYRDTDESRLTLIGGEQRYVPYWTPQDLLEARAVAAVTAPAGRATLDLHADGGWAHDRELGIARSFHPWRVSAGVTFPIGRFSATFGGERQSTVFYRADSIRFSLGGRL